MVLIAYFGPESRLAMQPCQIGSYKILRSIGHGGMGEVFLGKDGRLDRQEAIKLLPVELCESAERRQRFLEEARSASAINHPNTCVIYDVGETDAGQPFIAMAFVEEETLRTLVKQGPLATGLVVKFGIQWDTECPGTAGRPRGTADSSRYQVDQCHDRPTWVRQGARFWDGQTIG